MLAKFASLVFRVCSLLTGRPFRRFFAKPKCKPAAYCPLPNPLPRGEGTKLAEDPKMAKVQYPQSSLTERRDKLAENLKHGWVSISSTPSPAERGDKSAGNLKHSWVSASSIPSPRGRGLGRGQRTVRFAFYQSLAGRPHQPCRSNIP